MDGYSIALAVAVIALAVIGAAAVVMVTICSGVNRLEDDEALGDLPRIPKED